MQAVHGATRRTSHYAFIIMTVVLLVADKAGAELVLNEVLSAPASDWNGDGSVDFKLDEWVEILNLGPIAEDLSNVYLKDGSGDAYHFRFSGVLLPGETRIVYGHESVQWQASEGLSTTGLSLNNSGDRLELWRDVAEPRILDALDSVDIPSHAAAAERALGRATGAGPWVLIDGLNPYTGSLSPGGTDCAPSPDSQNSCAGSVAVEILGFGGLKAKY
jgi:hypothetical protein